MDRTYRGKYTVLGGNPRLASYIGCQACVSFWPHLCYNAGNMLKNAQEHIARAVSELYDVELEPQVSVPEEQFGDVASNVAMQLAKQVGQPPREIAEQIAERLRENANFNDVSVAGPGFLNIRFADSFLASMLGQPLEETLAGKHIVTEYSDPNVFKVLHVGHLYTSIIGDAIARLYELYGAKVERVNFGGDVGLHVAKAMWGIITHIGGELPEAVEAVPHEELADWIAQRYVEGNAAYESDPDAKAVIVDYNKAIYELHDKDEKDSNFARIYWMCRQACYDYFNAFYDRIGTPFDRYYPESLTAPEGLRVVKEQLGNGVFEISDGAVIFDGEKYGLHKRVFINSNGLPTYEAKDVGLSMLKWQDYHFDESVIITGNDILEYMKVVIKSIEQFAPEPAQRTRHITHGMVKLQGGVKMSSRLGNFIKATDILDMVTAAIGEQGDASTVLAATKYAFLKQSIGQDIWFDVEESIATHGNSGPYLQYAHARARSILNKKEDHGPETHIADLEPGERTLVRKLVEYPAATRKALDELSPHIVCGYLYELAQTFNRFYENNQVIDSEREKARLVLVKHYAEILKSGLNLLGIEATDRM